MEPLALVALVDWRSYEQYEYNNTKTTIPQAFQALWNVGGNSGINESDVRDQFLYAMGNNHCGSYYPAVLPALPILGQFLIHGSEESLYCTISILGDLYTCFHSARDFGLFKSDSGNEISMDDLVKAEIEKLKPQLELAAEKSIRVKACASDLFYEFRRPPGTK